MADRTRQDFAAAFSLLQDQIACPACRGPLRLDAEGLTCSDCGQRYAVVGGIPVLVADPSVSD